MATVLAFWATRLVGAGRPRLHLAPVPLSFDPQRLRSRAAPSLSPTTRRRLDIGTRVNRPLLTVSALLATTLASCGTLNRAGKDAVFGVATPLMMIYGGATDGASSAKSVRTGMDAGGVVEVLSFPFTFTYHAFEHFMYGVVPIL